MVPLKRLAIVIVDRGAGHAVVDCLKSLSGQVECARDVAIIVGAESSGASLSRRIEGAIVEHAWRSWVLPALSGDARSYSEYINIGIRSVRAEAYLIVHSETIVRPGAVASLVEAMERHPEAGLISLRSEWPDGSPQMCMFQYPSPMSELARSLGALSMSSILKANEMSPDRNDSPVEFEWTCFPSMMIRRSVLRDIGLPDTAYVTCFGDVDFCRRARDAGWSTLHWPDARVVHLDGCTSPVVSATPARRRRPGEYYAARARYFAKFYGRRGLFFANCLWVLGRGVSLFSEVLFRKARRSCEREWRDIWTNFLNPIRNDSAAMESGEACAAVPASGDEEYAESLE